MPAYSPWPPTPALLYRDYELSATTTSTSGAVLWGGGTTRSVPAGRTGIVRVELRGVLYVSAANLFGMFKLQDSTDGSSWTDVDGTGSYPWHDVKLTDTVRHPISLLFTYEKTAAAIRYLRILWRLDAAGTLGFETGTASGWSRMTTVTLLPTW